jgi:hypothetical protein
MIDFIQYIDYLYDAAWFINTFQVPYDVIPNTNDKQKSYPIAHRDGPMTLQLRKENISGYIYLNLYGSIHKYYNYITNGEEINHNDFTIDQIRWTVDRLCKKYNISYVDPDQQYITGVEFGMNISTSFVPATIVEHNIILHKEDGHATAPKHSRGGRTKTFVLTNYILKYYDKGIESKLPKHLSQVLRPETRLRNKRACKNHGIHQLTDLYDPAALASLYAALEDQIEFYHIG